MHAEYALINGLFLAPLGYRLIRRWQPANRRRVLRTLGIMVILTAVFDNLMIAAGIMAYNPAKLSGIMLGLAPLEDFAYTLAAVMAAVIVWERGRDA